MSSSVRLAAGGLAAFALALGAPSFAQAPDATALAAALTAHGAAEVAAADLRDIACDSDKEEPTEFECRWQQRTERGWHGYATWLALDGRGWTALDEPLPLPDPKTGKLK